MNIFILDKNPTKAAKNHCDKHAVKMILESVQMLITTYYALEGILKSKEITLEVQEKLFPGFPLKKETGETHYYRLTHINHPCTIWTRESLDNFNWLLSLAKELCKEYTLRYGKIHKLEPVLEWISENKPKGLKSKGLTPFATAMPEIYKTENPILSYRNYYQGDKRKFAKWKLGNIPSWWSL